MADFSPLDTDTTLLRLRASAADRTSCASLAEARRAGRSDSDLKNASEQFESLLLNLMIREMRATVPESGLFQKSMAEELFSGMLDERIAGEMAHDGGIGISRLIFEQLKGGK